LGWGAYLDTIGISFFGDTDYTDGHGLGSEISVRDFLNSPEGR
jgi:hypothetical protein